MEMKISTIIHSASAHPSEFQYSDCVWRYLHVVFPCCGACGAYLDYRPGSSQPSKGSSTLSRRPGRQSNHLIGFESMIVGTRPWLVCLLCMPESTGVLVKVPRGGEIKLPSFSI